MLTTVRMSFTFSAVWKYALDVDCMLMVWGAIVRISPAPAFADSDRNAWDMYVALSPFSRSMSTPSKPYVCISEYTEFAKFAADVGSLTETVPFWPPTETTTFFPAPSFALMSALNWSTVYPPSPAESRLKVTAPGVVVASANATAMMSYCDCTADSFWTVAPLLKFCQYPVTACFGSAPPPLPWEAVVVPVTAPDFTDSPAEFTAVTWKLYEVDAASPVTVAEAPVTAVIFVPLR